MKRLTKFKWLLLLPLSYLTVAHADTPIPQLWEYAGTTIDKPFQKDFDGPVTQLKSNHYADYLVWSKAEFITPQESKDGGYKTEIMLIKIQCRQNVYRIIRDIRYASDGHVISDLKNPSASKSIPLKYLKETVDLGKLPLDESFVVSALELNSMCIVTDD